MSAHYKSDIVIVGRFAGAYGIKGWLKLESFTHPKENIFSYHPWLIQEQGCWRQLSLAQIRNCDKKNLVQLNGIADRAQAINLAGSEIAVDKKNLPTTQEREFYWFEIINMQVLNEENKILGVVSGVTGTAANDVLSVESGARRYLIPYVPDVYIKCVDVKRKIIRVDWPFDLAEYNN